MPRVMPSQAAVQAFYDQTYQRQGLADPVPLYQRIVRLLEPVPGRILLDVACGQGDLLFYSQQAGLIPYGVDLSPAAIRRANARCPHAELAVADGESLPFPDEAFDYVVSLGSLEHYRDPDRGLGELARVLKPEGLACLMVPNVFWLGDVLEVLWRGECSSGFQIIERHGTRRGWERRFAAHGLAAHRTLRYNKPYPLIDPVTRKVKSVRKFLWRGLFNRACPFNLSLEFIYLCRKQRAPANT